MAISRTMFIYFLFHLAAFVTCKIILPQNLRYLENMLNADVIAKAAKIRQRIEANPNNQDSEKGWPMLLAKYQLEDNSKNHLNANNYAFNRRYPAA